MATNIIYTPDTDLESQDIHIFALALDSSLEGHMFFTNASVGYDAINNSIYNAFKDYIKTNRYGILFILKDAHWSVLVKLDDGYDNLLYYMNTYGHRYEKTSILHEYHIWQLRCMPQYKNLCGIYCMLNAISLIKYRRLIYDYGVVEYIYTRLYDSANVILSTGSQFIITDEINSYADKFRKKVNVSECIKKINSGFNMIFEVLLWYKPNNTSHKIVVKPIDESYYDAYYSDSNNLGVLLYNPRANNLKLFKPDKK